MVLFPSRESYSVFALTGSLPDVMYGDLGAIGGQMKSSSAGSGKGGGGGGGGGRGEALGRVLSPLGIFALA